MENNYDKFSALFKFQDEQLKLIKEGRLALRNKIIEIIREFAGVEVGEDEAVKQVIKSLPKEVQIEINKAISNYMAGLYTDNNNQ